MTIFSFEDHRRRVTVDDTGSTLAFFPLWGFAEHPDRPCKTKRKALDEARAKLELHGKSNPEDIAPVIKALDMAIADNAQQELFA